MNEGIISKHSTITQVLEDFGNEMQQSLKSNLASKGSNGGSGDLANQINFSSTIDGQGFVFTLRFKEYYDYVNQGVNGTKTVKNNTPYSYMTSSKIPFYFAKKWMNDNNMFATKGSIFTSRHTRKTYKAGSKDSQAFAMARSWKERGTKGNRFYDEVVTKERLDKLKKDLALAASGDMKTVITDSFKRLK